MMDPNSAARRPRRHRHIGKWFEPCGSSSHDYPAYYFYSAFPTGFAGWQHAKGPHNFWTCCGGEDRGISHCTPPRPHQALDDAVQQELEPEPTLGVRLVSAVKRLDPTSLERLLKHAEGLCVTQGLACADAAARLVGGLTALTPPIQACTTNIQSKMIAASPCEQRNAACSIPVAG